MDTEVPAIPTSGVGDYIGSLFTVLLSLALIVILIVMFIKLLSRKNRLWQMNQSIRLLGGTGIGQNKSLQVVEVGGTVYVLGVGEDITLVDKVSDSEQVALLLLSFEQADRQASAASMPASLSKWLRRSSKKRHNPVRSDDYQQNDEMEQVSFHEMFHSKLEQLPDRQARVERLLDDDIKKDR
ncbi:flagellar biosynthetic protein FliO [Paenibacillus marinisediminis]